MLNENSIIGRDVQHASEAQEALAKDLQGWKDELLNEAIEHVKTKADEKTYEAYELMVNEQAERALNLFKDKNIRSSRASFRGFVAKQTEKSKVLPISSSNPYVRKVSDANDVGSENTAQALETTDPTASDTPKEDVAALRTEQEKEQLEAIIRERSASPEAADILRSELERKHAMELEMGRELSHGEFAEIEKRKADRTLELAKLESFLSETNVGDEDTRALRDELETLHREEDETGERRHTLEDIFAKYQYKKINNITGEFNMDEFAHVRDVNNFKTGGTTHNALPGREDASNPLANSDQAEQNEGALSPETLEVLEAIKALDVVIREKSRAESDLRGNKVWNGLIIGLDNLLAQKEQLLKIEQSTLTPEQLDKHQRTLKAKQRDIEVMSRNKNEAIQYIPIAQGIISELVEHSIDNLAKLPAELQDAIKNANNKSIDSDNIFKKYGIDSRTARVIAISLPKVSPPAESAVELDGAQGPAIASSIKSENFSGSGLYEVRDGHIYNAADNSPDAVRLDTDPTPKSGELLPASGVDGVATEKPQTRLVYSADNGAVTYDIKNPVFDSEKDIADEALIDALWRKQHDPSKPPVYPEVKVTENPNLGGLYNSVDGDVRTGLEEGKGEQVFPPEPKTLAVTNESADKLEVKRNPDLGEAPNGEANAEIVESVKRGTWEEVDALMSDPDEKISALANEEWNRREQSALRYSVEMKTNIALEKTLEAIKSGHGDTVPKKWLNEFQEVPAVAKFLKERIATTIDAPEASTEEDISYGTPPDGLAPKTPFVAKLASNAERAQPELDALNTPEEVNTNIVAHLDAPIVPPVIDATEPEPLIARNFDQNLPEVPELVPIDQTPKVEPISSEQPVFPEEGNAMMIPDLVEPKSKTEAFIAVQKEYFAKNTEFIKKLAQASQVGDMQAISALEAEQKTLEESYQSAIDAYELTAATTTGQIEPDEINESAQTQDPEMQEADLQRFLAEYDRKIVKVIREDGNIEADWNVIGYTVDAKSLLTAYLRRQLADGTSESKQVSLPELDKWNAKRTEEVESEPKPELDLELPLEDVLGESEVKIEELPGAWNPEIELQNILKAPKAERKALLIVYRERLAAQKIGIGNAQKELIGKIKENPSISKADFLAQFTELTKDFHPTKEQFAIAEKAYDAYNKKHIAIEENFEKYNTPEALFTACFGMVPQGKVEVIKGPMTLYFRIHDDKDYAAVYKGKGQSAQTLDQGEIDDAKRTGGCAGVATLITELQGAVIAERTAGRAFEGVAKGIYDHEEQHAFNAVLVEGQVLNFDKTMNEAVAKDAIQSAKEEFAILNSNASAKDKEKARMMLERELEIISLYVSRMHRNERAGIADQHAADEILAFMKQGIDPKSVYEILKKGKEEGGLYDYLNDVKSKSLDMASEANSDPEFVKLLSRTLEKAKSEVFGKEYHDLIEEGISTFTSLSDHGLDKEAIISIFQHEPLSRWAKVAERLREDSAPAPLPEVAAQFKEKFGIDEEMIKAIPGFRELSPGQQLLTLKNLESMALEDVKKDATVLQKEEWAKKGIWKRMGLSMMTLGMSPDIRVAQIEKELAAKQRGGDANDPERVKILAKNLAALGELTKVAKAGPEVGVNEKGEISIKYVSSKDVFGALDAKHLTSENMAAIERFNAAADTYAKFPHEWGYETARPGFFERFKQDRRDYNKAKAEYDAAREAMTSTFIAKFAEREDKDPVQSAMIAMNKVDERMQLDQLFNTHPDAEDALLKVEDQSVIGAAAKEFWKKKGSFMVYGAAARAAAVAISGGVMLPVIALVGGGVGYGIGQAEGKKLMKAKRTDGRMSEEDVREEVEYAVFKKDENGKEIIDEKTGEKVVERVETRKIREFTDANFFVKRIDRLINKLEQSTDDAERELLEKKIAQTVALMKEKNERGMINFGGSSLEAGDERKGNTIANRLSFIQAMSKGEMETAIDKKALEAEMERITGARQETIEDVRKIEIRKMAVRSGLIRGSFTLAGGAIAQGVRELFHELSVDASDVAKVSSAIAAERPKVLPEVIAGPQQAAEANTYAEYMNADAAGKKAIAETLGKTIEEMDAKIAGILKGDISSEATGAPTANPALESAKRDGWVSEVVHQAQQDPKFNKDYIDNITGALGRNPAVGLSDTELNALQATDGVPAREAAHQALLKAIENSPNGKLSDDEVAKIMLENNVPTSMQEAAATLGRETVSNVESATASYEVKAGDNLTKIIKEHIAVMKDRTPEQQVKAIQNMLKRLSPEQMKAIGVTHPDRIFPGQIIHIDKINDLLGSERLMNINGESLINHAQHLGATAINGGSVAEAVTLGHNAASVAGFGEVHEIVGTLSASDTASIENTLGRSISASESSVLHSIKGLTELADTDAVKNNLNEAVAHLGQEMRASKGIPLTTEQMMFVLHQHNALDAQIRVPEAVIAQSAPVQTIEAASTPRVVESAPVLPLTPEASVANAYSISEIAAYIKHAPSADESFTLTNLIELERNTKFNPGLIEDIQRAKSEMIAQMKLADGEALTSLKMFKICEANHLDPMKNALVAPNEEVLAYISLKK